MSEVQQESKHKHDDMLAYVSEQLPLLGTAAGAKRMVVSWLPLFLNDNSKLCSLLAGQNKMYRNAEPDMATEYHACIAALGGKGTADDGTAVAVFAREIGTEETCGIVTREHCEIIMNSKNLTWMTGSPMFGKAGKGKPGETETLIVLSAAGPDGKPMTMPFIQQNIIDPVHRAIREKNEKLKAENGHSNIREEIMYLQPICFEDMFAACAERNASVAELTEANFAKARTAGQLPAETKLHYPDGTLTREYFAWTKEHADDTGVKAANSLFKERIKVSTFGTTAKLVPFNARDIERLKPLLMQIEAELRKRLSSTSDL